MATSTVINNKKRKLSVTVQKMHQVRISLLRMRSHVKKKESALSIIQNSAKYID